MRNKRSDKKTPEQILTERKIGLPKLRTYLPLGLWFKLISIRDRVKYVYHFDRKAMKGKQVLLLCDHACRNIFFYTMGGSVLLFPEGIQSFDGTTMPVPKSTVGLIRMADYAAVWRADDSEVPVLRPVYWICPVDLSSGMHRSGESLVGRVYKNQASEAVSGEAAAADTALAADFAGMEIGSIACVPLGSGNTCYGCVQFIRTPGKGPLPRMRWIPASF